MSNSNDDIEQRRSVCLAKLAETANLDKSITDTMRRIDASGEICVSKSDMHPILRQLREELSINQSLQSSNAFYKRLLLSACSFSVLTILAVSGLVHATVSLKQRPEIDRLNDNAWTDHRTHQVIATDDRAEVHTVSDTNTMRCVTRDEVLIWRHEVMEGRKVNLVDSSGVVPLGSSGMFQDGNQLCFTSKKRNKSYQTTCWIPDSACTNENSEGRTLSDEERSSLLGSNTQQFSQYLYGTLV